VFERVRAGAQKTGTEIKRKALSFQVPIKVILRSDEGRRRGYQN
jgi:hypothetical protein